MLAVSQRRSAPPRSGESSIDHAIRAAADYHDRMNRAQLYTYLKGLYMGELFGDILLTIEIDVDFSTYDQPTRELFFNELNRVVSSTVAGAFVRRS